MITFYEAQVQERADGSFSITSDQPELDLALELFQSGDRILVAGGAHGWTACRLAERFGVGQVFVYEPNPLNARMLRFLKIDGCSLQLKEAALSTQEGRQPFVIPRGCWPEGHLIASSPSELTWEPGGEVQTVPLERELRLQDINAALLDIEGAEWTALTVDALKNLDRLICEVHQTDGRCDFLENLTEMEGRCSEAGMAIRSVVGRTDGHFLFVAQRQG